MGNANIFDADLIRRYDRPGPRYTSYPTTPQFRDDFSEVDLHHLLARRGQYRAGRPLSLYVHVPFCERLCFFCACNKVVTRNRALMNRYLDAVEREAALLAELLPGEGVIDQLHWGGGSPTWLSADQMTRLMGILARSFRLRTDDGGEYSIEADPRNTSPETVSHLRSLGFNRISLGVQDFDERVQKAVNRVQSLAATGDVITAARAEGFKSVSVDLIYGLPFQTVDRFARSLDAVIDAAPDRISVFNYAHLPEVFKAQKLIDAADLPSASEKLALLGTTIDRLCTAGYVHIGMDHFARRDDDLSHAYRDGSMHRNFQGYSTRADCDLLALGTTAISSLGDGFSQNIRDLHRYMETLEGGRLPVGKGTTLTADDHLRRDIIMRLMCRFELKFRDIEEAHGIRFKRHFARELERLRPMERDGLVRMDEESVTVGASGRLLIRNIAMVFDAYLTGRSEKRFSKAI